MPNIQHIPPVRPITDAKIELDLINLKFLFWFAQHIAKKHNIDVKIYVLTIGIMINIPDTIIEGFDIA